MIFKTFLAFGGYFIPHWTIFSVEKRIRVGCGLTKAAFSGGSGTSKGDRAALLIGNSQRTGKNPWGNSLEFGRRTSTLPKSQPVTVP